jgi:hypothetical protein
MAVTLILVAFVVGGIIGVFIGLGISKDGV